MTLQVGDKTVVIPLRDGGRVTVRSGALSVGDKAVLIPGANGQIYAVRPASPQVGDKVIVYPLRNGGHVCLASADDEICITDAWYRLASSRGEVVSYGPISYTWDGMGSVYVSSSPDAAQSIQVDDAISISGPNGSLSPALPGVGGWHIGMCEITSILAVGKNAVTVSIYDTVGSNIGTATPLYIMRSL